MMIDVIHIIKYHISMNQIGYMIVYFVLCIACIACIAYPSSRAFEL